jgi:hypothetical protein
MPDESFDATGLLFLRGHRARNGAVAGRRAEGLNAEPLERVVTIRKGCDMDFSDATPRLSGFKSRPGCLAKSSSVLFVYC